MKLNYCTVECSNNFESQTFLNTIKVLKIYYLCNKRNSKHGNSKAEDNYL